LRQPGQALDVTRLRSHVVGQEALGHQAHVVGHPSGRELAQVLLEPRGVVAQIAGNPTISLTIGTFRRATLHMR
jgi:hypothetical protein